MKNALDKQREEMINIKKELLEKEKAIEELTKLLNDKDEEIEEFNKKLAETADQINEIKMLKETDDKNYNEAIFRLEEANQKLQTALEEKASQDVFNSMKSLHHVKANKNDLFEVNKKLEEKVKTKKTKINELKKMVEEFAPKIKSCEIQIKEYNKVLEESNNALKEKTLENSDLKDYLNKLKTENNKLKLEINTKENDLQLLLDSRREIGRASCRERVYVLV